MMKKHLMLIALIALILLAMTPVHATQTISFASIDGAADRDMYLYNASGTLLGLYNTTSTGIILPANESVIFTFKPQTANPLTDPGDFLTVAFGFVSTNIIPLVIMLFLVGLLFGRR
jgi:hypothetical protein